MKNAGLCDDSLNSTFSIACIELYSIKEVLLWWAEHFLLDKEYKNKSKINTKKKEKKI